jgi:ferrochelatase
VTDTVGVLLMAYGTPAATSEIETYYTDIRRGRPPSPELLADLVRRYDAIGGLSPLAERTEAQRQALERALEERRAGRYAVVLGFKHVGPKVEDTIAALGARGVHRVIGLVLAPHWSALSVGEYHHRAETAARGIGVTYLPIDDWHRAPSYVAFHAAAVRTGLGAMPANTKTVFTAHSLPARVLALQDPYPEAVRETAQAVAGDAGLGRWGSWCVAFQSAGRTAEPWLGPDLGTVIAELGQSDGATGVLVCAVGFVSDHLELLYDLDIQARHQAEAAGLAFARTPALNDDATVMGALADLVADRDGA